MRTIKAINNFKVDLFITFCLIALGFYLRTIFVTKMGADLTGVMLLFTQLTAYLNLAELGIGIAAASILYKPLNEANYARINYIISLLSTIYKYISVLVLLMGVTIGFGIYFFIDSVNTVNHVFVYWGLFVLNTSLTYLYAKHSTLLTANQQYSMVRKVQGGGKILIIAVQILILITTHNFLLYLFVETIGIITQYIIFKNIIKNNFSFAIASPDIEVKEKLTLKNELKIKIKNMFFHKIGGVLVLNTDYLLVSKFLNLSYVTIYGSYMMVFQVVTVLMSSFVNAITASMGNFLINQNKDEITNIAKQFNAAFIALATFIVLNMYFLVNAFITNWIGAAFTLNKGLVILMLINVFISVIRIPCDIFKNATGFFGDVYYPLLEGIINLFFSAFLAYYIGLSGIIIGTIISNVLITLVAKPLYLYGKMFGRNKALKNYLSFTLKPVIFSFAIFAIFYFVEGSVNALQVATWLDFAGKLFIVSLASALIIFVVFYADTNFRSFVNRILRVVLSRN